MSTPSKHIFTRRDLLKAGAAALPVMLCRPSLGTLLPFAPVRRSTFVMGAVATIEAYSADEKLLQHAITKAFDELHRIDAMMSVYNENSYLSAINRTAGNNAVEVPVELLEVIAQAKAINTATNGYFDITVEPLMRMWGFRDENNVLLQTPTDRQIANAVEAVGYGNIQVGTTSVGLRNRRTQIDLGGIAVGYAIDRAARILEREGVTQALINHSGDILALDAPSWQNGWQCVIPNPRDPREFIHEFTIERQAVSTSGSYEKFVECDGRRYGHIMTPEAGRPSEQLLSTTVISRQAISSDAFSTALFAMPVGKAELVGKTAMEIDQCFLIAANDETLQLRSLR